VEDGPFFVAFSKYLNFTVVKVFLESHFNYFNFKNAGNIFKLLFVFCTVALRRKSDERSRPGKIERMRLKVAHVSKAVLRRSKLLMNTKEISDQVKM
jgi:hypothetical protein